MDKKAPIIRFNGFTDDWEQRELSSLSTIFDGTHSTPNYQKKGVMFLSVENIRTMTSSKYISEEAFNKEFKYSPEKGDILMTRIGDIGTANMVRTGNPIAFYVSLALFKHISIDNLFLLWAISSEKVQGQLWRRTLHVAFPQKINKGEIGKIIVDYPRIPNEQMVIGKFFEKLTETIALYQEQLELYKTLKTAMLQQLFPSDGETNPKVRFAEFHDDWEQSKLGDDITFINGRAFKQDELLDHGKYKVVRVGNFNTNNQWYYSDLELDSKKYVEYGDLLYLWATNFGPEMWKQDKTIFHYHIWKLDFNKKHYNKNFLFSWLEQDKQKILTDTNGSTMIHITKENMENRKIKFSSSIIEQKDIGDLLSTINQTIAVYQDQLDVLISLKSSMLQRMFI